MWASIKHMLRAYRCYDGKVARADLARWYTSPPGRSLAESEQALLDDVLSNLFGYHLLQVTAPQGHDLSTISRIPHRMLMTEPATVLMSSEQAPAYFLGQPEYLPLATESVDLVLLPHVVEFTDDPHAVLREAERVLIAEGYVLVLGFNPWSLWGLWRLLFRWRRRAPWCGRFLSPWRMQDWLSLLGFKTVALHHIYYRPPLSQPGFLQRLQFFESWGRHLWPVFGGVYLMVAKKRVLTLTPIRPRWRPQRAVVNPGFVSSTVGKLNG
ncbi:MAG: methyltransferase domain-containing protein [Thiohalomonadaceae bacterium]